MAFNIWNKTIQKNTDLLNSLKNRLDTSTYQEDLLDTLGKLYEFCFIDISELTDVCFGSIIKSLAKTEDCLIQIKILQMISISNYKSKILTDKELFNVILDQNSKFLAFFVKFFLNEDLKKDLILNPNINSAIKRLQITGNYAEILNLITGETELKENLVFEGLLEFLIEDFENKKNDHKMLYKLINEILKDSEKNQYYLASGNFNRLSAESMQIFRQMLNVESKKFVEIQKILFTKSLVKKAISEKFYEFIYLVVYKNEPHFDFLIQNYIDLDVIIRDTETDIFAYKILELIIRCTDMNIPKTDSIRINTLLYFLGLEFAEIEITQLSSIDHIIYLIFTQNEFVDVKFSMDPNLYDEPIQSFIVLLNLQHGIKMNIVNELIYEKMQRLRAFIINNNITLESLREALLEQINQAISERLEFFPKKTIQKVETPKIALSPLPVQNENKNIVEGVKNNLKELLGRFGRSDNSSKKGYDL